MPDEKNNTVRFPSYVLLPLVAAVIILCVKIIYYPHASGYAAYGFTSITLILFIVPIILIVNFFYTRFTKMNKPPSRSPALSWINRRRSFRIHSPYGQRPKLIIDRTDNIDRRGLEFLILDLSQNGLRLADDGCLGPIEFLSGKLQLPLLPDNYPE